MNFDSPQAAVDDRDSLQTRNHNSESRNHSGGSGDNVGSRNRSNPLTLHSRKMWDSGASVDSQDPDPIERSDSWSDYESNGELDDEEKEKLVRAWIQEYESFCAKCSSHGSMDQNGVDVVDHTAASVLPGSTALGTGNAVSDDPHDVALHLQRLLDPIKKKLEEEGVGALQSHEVRLYVFLIVRRSTYET